MATLKDLLVNGASRLIGDVYTSKVQMTTIQAPTSSNSTAYGPGTNGQVLKSNGTSVYWGTDNNSGGTVTSVRVQATSPVVSSVNTAQTSSLNTTISLANNYGDTKNPYAAKNANLVLAGPSSGSSAVPSFRALVANDIPTISITDKTTGTLSIARGGTNSTTTAGALSNLGLGNAKIFYGTCDTAAATSAKAVTCTAFTSANLVAGAIIFVKFTNTNSAAVSGLTLSVNSTTAKAIKYQYNNSVTSALPSPAWLVANQTYCFTYDGTNWITHDISYNTDNVYSRSYKSNTNIDLPIAALNTNASVIANYAEPSEYANAYGAYPTTTASRATYNPSNGLLKVPGGIYTNGLRFTFNNNTIEFDNTGVYDEAADYFIQWGSSGVLPEAWFNKVHGAVFNDYAEYRKENPEEKEIQKPGRVVREVGNGSLALTTERLERGCEIISDTFGFAIGEDKKNGYTVPVASNGRVLAYPFESIEVFKSHIGWPVCSGPNGTVSIMSEAEEEQYPSRIIGTISEIPDYEVWGSDNVKVNGRVWIRIK